jgi:hypothetical protein
LAAQALPPGFSGLMNDPWLKPAVNFVIDRALVLVADPQSLQAFFQANSDDFSPGFFKTRLGPEWRNITDRKLDDRSSMPFSQRFDLSVNLITIVPSAQVQFHALPEGRYWPQVSVALSGWTTPLSLALPGVVSAWGFAPHLTLSKSLAKDAKLFGGYQVATGDFRLALSNLSGGLVPDIALSNYTSHELFLGVVFLDRVNAEYAAWVDLNLTRQEVYLKAERTRGALTLGLGFYPDRLLGLLPLPYARFRVRI